MIQRGGSLYTVRQDFDYLNGSWVPIVIISTDEDMDFSAGTVFKIEEGPIKKTYYCEAKPYREFTPGIDSLQYHYWFVMLSKETILDTTEELKARMEASESAILGLMQMQLNQPM